MRTVILKLFVISGLLFSQATLIHAQAAHVNIVHLEADKNLPGIIRLPFDTVIVIDNRSEHGSAIGSELSKVQGQPFML